MPATTASSELAGSFSYDRLHGTEIRIVNIGPERVDDSIYCLIETVTLDNDPKFCALSYVWGDPADSVCIKLNDEDFQVTQTLFQALKQLRKWVYSQECQEYFGRIMPFWIDALCIDQTNLKEKETQIPRMGSIFSSAANVIAWLGPLEDLDSAMIELIFNKAKYLASRYILSIANPQNFYDWLDNYPIAEELGSRYRPFVETFRQIIGRPWFRRIWILQEAVLARSDLVYFIGPHFSPSLFLIYCMLRSKSCQDISTQASITRSRSFAQAFLLKRLLYPPTPSPEDPSAVVEFGKMLGQIVRVASSQRTAPPYESTIPHDMIYGLLGIASVFSPSTIIPAQLLPDYSEPFFKVYEAYTRFIIESSHDLTILEGRPVHLDPKARTSPSWVRDFRTLGVRVDEVEAGCPKTRAISAFLEDGKTLAVWGHRLGRVEVVFAGQILAPEDEVTRSEEEPLDLLLCRFEDDILRPASILQQKDFASVLQLYLDRFNERAQDIYRLFARTSTTTRMKQEGAELMRHPGSESFNEMVLIRVSHTHNQIILLSDGTILVVRDPVTVQVGDVVCFFKGSCFPLLIRSSLEHVDQYNLIAYCEVLVGTYKGPYNDELFSNREIRMFHLV